jgi:DNA-binding transcriptional ArsR family regulator
MARPDLRDPRVLRAIAHPVRNRILTELGASGSMRAADVARELDIPANQASFHLRQLAKYGLVEEDREAARDKRDRVWLLTFEEGVSINLGDFEREPEGAAAAGVFRQQAAAWGRAVVDAVYSPAADGESEILRTVNDSAIRLTLAEAQELAAELDQFVSAWRRRTRGSDADRRTYLLFAALQPHPDLHRKQD